ncbi:MAG TPA: hypothetical protein VMW87_04660 [Spirochaetia bacterium]|nr:hypothetical protein [Spirochaetia bacterium]
MLLRRFSARIGTISMENDAMKPTAHRSGGLAGKLTLTISLAALFCLLSTGCATSPPQTKQVSPPNTPAMVKAPAPANAAPAAGTVTDPAGKSGEDSVKLQDEIDSLKARLSEAQKKNDALVAANRSLDDALNQIAFAKGLPPDQLLRQSQSGGNSGSAIPTGGFIGTSAPSLVTGSVINDTLDPATGTHTLVDMRANAGTGDSLYLSITYTDGGAPQLHLTIQHRYLVGDPPFMVRSVTVVAGKSVVSPDLTLFTLSRYRSDPFKIESADTTDLSVISQLLQTILGEKPRTDAATPTGEAQIAVLETGLRSSFTRLLSLDEIRALSNMLYAYRELGGKAL